MRESQGFWYFARLWSREIQINPRNPAKFTKTRKIPQNLVEILSNTYLYNIFETYFSYRGYLLVVNLQIYLGTSSLKRANNVPKLPGVDYVAKNWALAMMLSALPLVHFWSENYLTFSSATYQKPWKVEVILRWPSARHWWGPCVHAPDKQRWNPLVRIPAATNKGIINYLFTTHILHDTRRTLFERLLINNIIHP